MSDRLEVKPALTELVEVPEHGRVFAQDRRPLLSDCGPSGRVRLDAVACWFQDIAYLDVEDARVADLAVWVVRRSRIAVLRFPRFGERLRLETFCSGLGRMWAERRTRISSVEDGRALVEGVSLWVHLDPLTRRPAVFTEPEIAVFGETAGERRITARLRHPSPPALASSAPWTFRAADCDLAGHVNNAAYWLPLEEELLPGPDPQELDAEIEFRSPAQPGEMVVLEREHLRWIVDHHGETHATIVLAHR